MMLYANQFGCPLSIIMSKRLNLTLKSGDICLGVNSELLSSCSVFWCLYTAATGFSKDSIVDLQQFTSKTIEIFWFWCSGKDTLIEIADCLDLFDLCVEWGVFKLAEKLVDLIIMSLEESSILQVNNRIKIYSDDNCEPQILKSVNRIQRSISFYVQMHPKILPMHTSLTLVGKYFETTNLLSPSFSDYVNIRKALTQLSEIENMCFFGGAIRDLLFKNGQARLFYDKFDYGMDNKDYLYANPDFDLNSSSRTLCPQDIDIILFGINHVSEVSTRLGAVRGLHISQFTPLSVADYLPSIDGVVRLRVQGDVPVDVVYTSLEYSLDNFELLMRGNAIHADCLMVRPGVHSIQMANLLNLCGSVCTSTIRTSAFECYIISNIEKGITELKGIIITSNGDKLNDLKILQRLFLRVVKRLQTWTIKNMEWDADLDSIFCKADKQYSIPIEQYSSIEFANNLIHFSADRSCKIFPSLDIRDEYN